MSKPARCPRSLFVVNVQHQLQLNLCLPVLQIRHPPHRTPLVPCVLQQLGEDPGRLPRFRRVRLARHVVVDRPVRQRKELHNKAQQISSRPPPADRRRRPRRKRRTRSYSLSSRSLIPASLVRANVPKIKSVSRIPRFLLSYTSRFLSVSVGSPSLPSGCGETMSSAMERSEPSALADGGGGGWRDQGSVAVDGIVAGGSLRREGWVRSDSGEYGVKGVEKGRRSWVRARDRRDVGRRFMMLRC